MLPPVKDKSLPPLTIFEARRRSLLVCMAMEFLAACSSFQSENAYSASPAPLEAKPPQPADIRDVFGITLGRQVTMRECRKEDIFGVVTYAKTDIVYPCFRDPDGAGDTAAAQESLPERDGEIEIELGFERVPSGVSPHGTLLVLKGIPERITLFTHGASVQSPILKLLTSKYGKPTRLVTERMKTAEGTRIESIRASWDLSSITVSFNGTVNPLNPLSGIIVASTRAGAKWLSDRAAEADAAF